MCSDELNQIIEDYSSFCVDLLPQETKASSFVHPKSNSTRFIILYCLSIDYWLGLSRPYSLKVLLIFDCSSVFLLLIMDWLEVSNPNCCLIQKIWTKTTRIIFWYWIKGVSRWRVSIYSRLYFIHKKIFCIIWYQSFWFRRFK